MSLGFKFTAKSLILKGIVSEKGIDTIKDFLKKCEEKAVPKCLPEEFTTSMLVACSNDVNLTKKSIISYFNIKKMAPCLFDNRNLENKDLQLALRTTSISSIHWPEKNSDIVYVKLRDTDYRNCYMEPQLKVACMIIDSIYVTHPPDAVIIVFDAEGLGMMHITRLKFDSLKIFFSYIQEGLPVKLKSIHFVNSNYVLRRIMDILRLFIKPELNKKLHFHSGIKELVDYIPKHCMPTEFGGELSSIEDYHIHLVKRMKEMEKFWKGEEAMRKQCFSDRKYFFY